MLLELADAIKQSTERCLEDRVAVAFSGGLDSSLITHIAKKNSECEITLFSIGTENCKDLEYAEKVAATFNLKLNKIILSENEVIETYNKTSAMLKLDFLKIGILIPIYKAAEAASLQDFKVMLFGFASEELFIGYDRYYKFAEEKGEEELDKLLREEFAALKGREINWAKKICCKFGIEARFPFYDKKIADLVFSIPVNERMAEKELKKGILREIGKFLGLPELVLKRKKQAMQYGSGVQKILVRHRNECLSYPLLGG